MGVSLLETAIKGAFLFFILLAREGGGGGGCGGSWHLALCLQAHQRNIKCLWLISSGLRSSIIPSEPIRVAAS